MLGVTTWYQPMEQYLHCEQGASLQEPLGVSKGCKVWCVCVCVCVCVSMGVCTSCTTTGKQ